MGPFIYVTYFGCLVIVFFYLKFFRDTTKISKFVNKYYGPPRVPILGSALETVISDEVTTQRVHFDWPKDYGPRYCVSLGSFHFFSTHLHQDIEKILKSTTNLDKGEMYSFVDFLNDGLTHIPGKKWVGRRKLLNPSFHWRILQNFQSVFDQQSRILLSILKRDQSDEQPFDIVPYMNRLALDIICETAMGVTIGSQNDPSNDYLHAVEDITTLFKYRASRPWLYPKLIWSFSSQGKRWKKNRQIMNALRDKVICAKKAEMQAPGRIIQNYLANSPERGSWNEDVDDISKRNKSSLVFIDLLLAAQDDEENCLKDVDIQAEVDTFIFVGNDTTAPAMSWCAFNLAGHPQEQEKVIEELDEIFGSDQTRPITTDDLGKMKYLECCIKETLRLRPPAALIVRKLVQDLVLDDKTVVPAGINFYIPILQIHRDPTTFPEPDQFKPERFLPENSVGRNPYAFIPFSMGPRNCIGQKYAMMEMKTVVANILRNYRLETTKTIQDIRLNIYGVLRPADPLPIAFKRRSVQCN